jgi:hypothetical protein
MAATGCARWASSGAKGGSVTSSTVVASTARTSSIELSTKRPGAAVAGSRMRPNDATTASASNGVPSWKVTPSRSVSRSVVGSG